jgi:hypothetical protein
MASSGIDFDYMLMYKNSVVDRDHGRLNPQFPRAAPQSWAAPRYKARIQRHTSTDSETCISQMFNRFNDSCVKDSFLHPRFSIPRE